MTRFDLLVIMFASGFMCYMVEGFWLGVLGALISNVLYVFIVVDNRNRNRR